MLFWALASSTFSIWLSHLVSLWYTRLDTDSWPSVFLTSHWSSWSQHALTDFHGLEVNTCGIFYLSFSFPTFSCPGTDNGCILHLCSHTKANCPGKNSRDRSRKELDVYVHLDSSHTTESIRLTGFCYQLQQVSDTPLSFSLKKIKYLALGKNPISKENRNQITIQNSVILNLHPFLHDVHWTIKWFFMLSATNAEAKDLDSKNSFCLLKICMETNVCIPLLRFL